MRRKSIAGCKPGFNCASNSRCGHDHSSRAPQSPSLVSLDVVREMLLTAFVNMGRRHFSLTQGQLTEEQVKEKDEYLVRWLTDTFCGNNRHFEVGPEDWNPHGLATYLKGALAPLREGGEESFPEKDDEVLSLVFDLFVDQVSLAVDDCITDGYKLQDPKDLPATVDHFIEVWSMLLTGAPIGEEIN